VDKKNERFFDGNRAALPPIQTLMAAGVETEQTFGGNF
jgi:hypothetical protein